MLNERDAAYRGEEASNFLIFIIVMIIIQYIFTMYLVDYQRYQFLFVLH